MPSSIRFPTDLPQPSRDGYEDTFEAIGRAFTPEVGEIRQRRRMRAAPRVVTLQLVLSGAQYLSFDRWWQTVILGGAREFDLQLSDDDGGLTWFTVRQLDDYQAELSSDRQEWTIRWRVRAVDGTFGTTRDSGTDELIGYSRPGVTCRGALHVFTPLRSITNVGIAARATFAPPPLRSTITVGMYRLPRATFAPYPLGALITVGVESAKGALSVGTGGGGVGDPELSRQWMNVDWLYGLAAGDINADEDARKREWMEV